MKSSKSFMHWRPLMESTDPLLRTREVAERLQVSVSTVKRWVDAGTIEAVRTPGRHRKVPVSEADRMARLLAGGVATLGRAASATVDDPARDRLVDLLRRGERREAMDLVKSLSRSGCPAPTLADDLIRPVMERIGHGWLIGSVDVFEEHQASQAIAGALHELIAEQAGRPAAGPLAIGATPEGDPYVLSCLLGELLLRELGWEVRNLGVDLPLNSLASATLAYRPRIVFLSVNNHAIDEALFARDFTRFHEAADAVGAAVIIGGRAVGTSLRSRIAFASYGERMVHLAAFARGFWSGTAAARERPRGQA
jgi:excisionase family DNA binding protein